MLEDDATAPLNIYGESKLTLKEQLKYIKQLLAERIAEHTGQTVDQVNKDSDRDRWFTAEQAREYGIIDEVILRRREIEED